jgi:hypothetical protein
MGSRTLFKDNPADRPYNAPDASIQSEQFEDHYDNHDHADNIEYTVTHIIRDSHRLSLLRVWIAKSAQIAHRLE